jgi:hypothetical protein
MKLALTFILMGSMLGSAGCATRVVPPMVHGDAVMVHLSDYSRHSSLLLPTAGGFEEYAFGDWDFFARGDARWWVGLRALLLSPQATLGRRFVPAPDGTLAAADIRAQRLMLFNTSAARADALKLTLDSQFNRATGPPMYSNYSKLYHIQDPEAYCLFHNCNHVTARWLRQLGCKVEGTAITSNFQLEHRQLLP